MRTLFRILPGRAVLALFILFAVTGTAWGESAVTCHCFRDRSYDPARKFSADEYILATSFNSLLSAWAVLPKRSLVMAKMEGADSGDLTAAVWVGAQTEKSYKDILGMKRVSGSWARFLSPDGKDPSETWRKYLLGGGGADSDVVKRAEEALLSVYFGVENRAVRRLRGKGLGTKEIALALALSARTGRSLYSIIESRLTGGKSWGEMLNALALVPENAGPLMESLLPVRGK